MPTALIIGGPCGVGKSTISKMIADSYSYVHCDCDAFKWMYSHERSKERTAIGETLGFAYAKEILEQKRDIIIEALPEMYLEKLKPLLSKHGYTVVRIRLAAPLSQCLANNAQRKTKYYHSDVIRDVYDKYSHEPGDLIDATGKTARQVFEIIRKKYFSHSR